MITMSDKVDQLIPAIHKARKAIRPVLRGGRNQTQNYRYAQESDWYDAITPALEENGLVIFASAGEPIDLGARTTRKGNMEYAYGVPGRVRLIHTSAQWVEVTASGHGQDAGDKGVYKAQTGLKKYLYALLFMLPTTDDPERDDAPQTPAVQPRPAGQPTLDERCQSAVKLIAEATNEKRLDELEAFVSKVQFNEAHCRQLAEALGNRRSELQSLTSA